jgi:hypothetical protein
VRWLVVYLCAYPSKELPSCTSPLYWFLRNIIFIIFLHKDLKYVSLFSVYFMIYLQEPQKGIDFGRRQHFLSLVFVSVSSFSCCYVSSCIWMIFFSYVWNHLPYSWKIITSLFVLYSIPLPVHCFNKFHLCNLMFGVNMRTQIFTWHCIHYGHELYKTHGTS